MFFILKYTDKRTLILALSNNHPTNLATGKNQIGFVPTMGALHAGHISLVERALEENDIVVVSIFVNPTQFNSSVDLEKYPRTEENDLFLLEKLNKNVLVYIPSVDDIYENGVVPNNYDFEGLEKEMEGKHRHGHFNGVGTVVSKLFEIIKPDKAYFGEKDFQQLQIIKKLVFLEKFAIEIMGCPIVREKNGLAMSSRNKRLNQQEQEEAGLIYRTLMEVREKFISHSLEELQELVSERFLSNPYTELEYFDIADEETLKTAKYKKPSIKYRAFIAVFIGGVRLIDNMSLN